MRVVFSDSESAVLMIAIAFDEEPGLERGQMRESFRPATAEDVAQYGGAYADYVAAGGALTPPPPAAPQQQAEAAEPPAERAGPPAERQPAEAAERSSAARGR